MRYFNFLIYVGTDPEDHYFRGCIHNMLAEPQEEGLFSSEQVKKKFYFILKRALLLLHLKTY